MKLINNFNQKHVPFYPLYYKSSNRQQEQPTKMSRQMAGAWPGNPSADLAIWADNMEPDLADKCLSILPTIKESSTSKADAMTIHSHIRRTHSPQIVSSCHSSIKRFASARKPFTGQEILDHYTDCQQLDLFTSRQQCRDSSATFQLMMLDGGDESAQQSLGPRHRSHAGLCENMYLDLTEWRRLSDARKKNGDQGVSDLLKEQTGDIDAGQKYMEKGMICVSVFDYCVSEADESDP